MDLPEHTRQPASEYLTIMTFQMAKKAKKSIISLKTKTLALLGFHRQVQHPVPAVACPKLKQPKAVHPLVVEFGYPLVDPG